MTEIFCETQSEPLPGVVDSEPWQMRLKALGIRQNAFADAVGLTATNLSEGLRGTWKAGVPQYLRAIIIALEALEPMERLAWLEEARRERQKP